LEDVSLPTSLKLIDLVHQQKLEIVDSQLAVALDGRDSAIIVPQ